MTDWQPAAPLNRRGVTKHKQLADAIVADIESGRLRHGQRLPPHRDLALTLGVSVQTVSLSYKEVERLGFLSSEVGRGTFVKGRVTDRADRFMLDRSPGDLLDLSIVRAVYTDRHETAARALMTAMGEADNSAWMRPCRPIAGIDRHRDVGRHWLRRLGVDAGIDRILITNGAAQGVFLAVAAVVQPGDVVLTEELTDHGIIGMASVLGFTLRGLPTDAEGILPDAFDEACAGGPVRALVTIPTFTNPTSHLAGAERRRRIAEVARRHGVFVIEDEVYKPLLEEPLPAIADLVPELGFFVTSFTKSVMTGLRTGYLVVPPQLSIRTASILRVTGWSGVAAVGEMAARWIEEGVADTLLAVQRTEVRARQAIVAEELGALVAGSHPLSLSAWLRIPDPWNEESLIRVLRERGVAATPSEPFVVGGAKGRRGMRLCVGGRMTHGELRHALGVVRSTFLQLPPINETGFLS